MKYFKKILLSSMLIFALGTSTVYLETYHDLDDHLSVTQFESLKGKIHLQGETDLKDIKVQIKHDDTISYQDLYIQSNTFDEYIWLLDGKGNYTISILLHQESNLYSKHSEYEVANTYSLSQIDTTGMFINPEKHISSDSNEIKKLAQNITKDSSSDIDKAFALYTWVSNNIDYDYDKCTSLMKNEKNIELGSIVALHSRKGICYDYATLYAALARSINMETKLIKGYSYNDNYSIYHAWNEIYLDDEERWVNLDATYGSNEINKYFDTDTFESDYFKEDEM